MFDKIYSHINRVYEDYNEGIKVANAIFDAAKLRDFTLLPDLNKQQNETLNRMKLNKNALGEAVKSVAESLGINDFRIQSILHCFSQVDKERILDSTKSIMVKESELERALLRNQSLLASMITATEAIVDSALYLKEKKGMDNLVFLDKKF